MMFNFARWDATVHQFDKITNISLDDLNLFQEDVILQLNLNKSNQPLFILLKNFSQIKNFPNIIVSFGGALTTKGIPPYFSFNNISNEIKCPLISISDPSLYLNESIKLSWYAGNNNYLNLQESISEVVTYIVSHFNKKPILTGGSGGGFASLAISSLLQVPHVNFIWNPQTSIKLYYRRFVDEYIDTAFPNFTSKNIHTQFLRIDQYKIISDVTSKSLSPHSELLYLQCDTDDFHINNHCQPFIKNQNFTLLESKSYNTGTIYSKDDKYIYLSNWGDGHVPPNKKTLLYVLRALLENIKVEKILQSKLEDYFL